MAATLFMSPLQLSKRAFSINMFIFYCRFLKDFCEYYFYNKHFTLI